MKYLLAGLSAYSFGAGFWFYTENQTPVSLLIGGWLSLILLAGSLALMISGKEK